MNPRSHLRLIYEANPLGFLAEQVVFALYISWHIGCLPLQFIVPKSADSRHHLMQTICHMHRGAWQWRFGFVHDVITGK